jgi:hypothetical protein
VRAKAPDEASEFDLMIPFMMDILKISAYAGTFCYCKVCCREIHDGKNKTGESSKLDFCGEEAEAEASNPKKVKASIACFLNKSLLRFFEA